MERNQRNTWAKTAAVAGMLLAGLAGCQATRHASPLVTEYDQASVEAELDFWHGLAEQPLTTNNDAMHGLIELANDRDPNTSYADRLAWLKQRDLLAEGFDQPADRVVSCGTVAQVLANILEIDGGVTMHLIGAHPRYATRELIYLEIMRPSTPQQAMSGIEFVGTIGRARDYDGKAR